MEMSNRAAASRHPLQPYTLVWAPIPLVSWIAPFIGHMGVCCSTGLIYDFQGPYTIGVDEFLFGNPARFVVVLTLHTARYKHSVKGWYKLTVRGFSTMYHGDA